MLSITWLEPRLDQRLLIVRYPAASVVGRFLVEQKASSSSTFCCETRCALNRGRVKARSGQNRAKSAHRLTDALPGLGVSRRERATPAITARRLPSGTSSIGKSAGRLTYQQPLKRISLLDMVIRTASLAADHPGQGLPLSSQS
jgi:hypothetical protein